MAKRKDDRVIIHFDYDCFYASVFEAENPTLKSLPLAVQQKQIIVTCNYEARRRGLRKLQLITDAKKTCPEVVIVLGEDLTRFRDASKILYKFLESFTWNKKVERLGFDEVFMDVTDIVDYNQGLLNPNNLGNSFFQTAKGDPTQGFTFDASEVSGHSYPHSNQSTSAQPIEAADRHLHTRLILGSHLARHLRHRLEEDKGYTSTVGISTTKLIAKLVANLHKPKGQTTLLPPYTIPQHNIDGSEKESNITTFVDGHDIGKIPAAFDEGLIYGGTKENVTVRDVRLFPGMGPELLERILGGKPGAEKGIGGKIWNLINGVDNTEVKDAKSVPSQISIEDSYIKLDTFPQVVNELRILAKSLLRRMHMDLVEEDDDDVGIKDNHLTAMDQGDISNPASNNRAKRKWIAHPKTLRLSTRPRPPLNPDGTRTRSFNRISRSAPLPNFIFNLRESSDAIVEKLIHETLLPMFRKLHPEKAGWNLSLVNICVANMAETAGDGKGGGRDIGMMFRKQESFLREWRVVDRDVPPDGFDEDGLVEKVDGFERNVSCERIEGDWAAIDGNPILEHQAEEDHRKMDESEKFEAEPSAGNEAINSTLLNLGIGSEDQISHTQESSYDDNEDMVWDNDGEYRDGSAICAVCGAYMPDFAMAAHERFHGLDGDEG